MIISASRRTDIPAFYADWFMNRIRDGYCYVPNPFNPKQISKVPLLPEDVEAVVFWSKLPEPLFGHLDELDSRRYIYYFLFTVNDYPAALEPGMPPLDHRLSVFKQLSERLGPERVIWRYDPIVISSELTHDDHRRRFEHLSSELSGHTHRVIVSLVNYYRKTNRRLSVLEHTGTTFDRDAHHRRETHELFRDLLHTAASNGMTIRSCAEPDPSLRDAGISPGRCIDDVLIKRLGGRVPSQKDRGQRDACQCVVSKDIGVSDTCLHGCRYCYATRNNALACKRYLEHDPQSTSLWG
jgi:hypothetical protein